MGASGTGTIAVMLTFRNRAANFGKQSLRAMSNATAKTELLLKLQAGGCWSFGNARLTPRLILPAGVSGFSGQPE
jgi:hypothetical protein